MNSLAGLVIAVATLQAAHATQEDYKAMASKAYEYVQQINTAICASSTSDSLPTKGIEQLKKLKENKNFMTAVCASMPQNQQCGNPKALVKS
jgi:hypothetical protein